MQDEKTGFIYIWYDKKRKMYYLGCHIGKEDDGYICSSKWMRDAYRYRKQDFKRRILSKKIPLEKILEEEFKWLSMISDNELGKKYYNLNKHHHGHWIYDTNKQLTIKQKLSEASKKLHQNPLYRQKFLEGRKNIPQQTKEQIEKRAKANTGKKRTEETKRKIKEALTGKVYGPLSEDHKKKVSDSLKGDKNPFYGKQHDPELKAKMNLKTSQTMKGRIPSNIDMFRGSKWWNNGIINKRSIESPGIEWNRGLIK